MASRIIMPQGGQDIEIGKVIRWAKREGEAVAKGEVICEVETEKAVFEITSPEDGILLKILVAAGEEAKIFSEIGVVGQTGESVEIQVAKDGGRGAAPLAEREIVTRRTAAPKAGPILMEVRASPKAKKIAGELAISLERVIGTGPQGRITAEDVVRTSEGKAPPQELLAGKPIAGREIQLTKVGRIMAKRMQQSKQVIPHFYLSTTADMTRALDLQRSLNEETGAGEGEKVTVTDMIVRASVLALEAFPRFNCSVKDETTIVQWEDINVGVATATDEGLVVPVLADARGLTLREVARQRRRIVAMAREGKQATLASAHFTVSNLGMFKIDNFIAVINPPEVAILAVSSIHKAVMPQDDATSQTREVMSLTLSADHRAIDGSLAAQFLSHIRQQLEEPESL